MRRAPRRSVTCVLRPGATLFALFALFALVASSLAACRGPSRAEEPRRSGEAYGDPSMWLCRPDLPDDACHGDLTATELHADGSRSIDKHVAAAAPAVDCFYVYPTVDLHLRAGNHADFEDLKDVRETALAQVARFREVCAVYAPLYRQASIGTYAASDEDKERFFGVAYSDVAAAFAHYRAHLNHGRRIVMIGHSQGAQMIARLLRDTFDRDAALRQQLVVAMPIGFYFDVPKGAATGGTFENLPVCASDAQLGCVVAYRTLAAGDAPDAKFWPLPAGREAICVDPAGAGSGTTPLSRSYLATARAPGVRGVDTPFVLLRDFYQARCVSAPDGRDYLEVAEARAPGDARPSPVDLGRHHGFLGLHVYDFAFTQGDLIDLVKKKVAALPPE